MVRQFLVLAVLLLGTRAALADQSPTLNLVSTFWPPFTDESAKPRLAIELVQTTLERAGIKSTIQIRDDAAWIQGLQRGTFAGTAAIWRSKEREAFLEFSESYLENRLVLIARRGSVAGSSALNNFKNLEGKRIGLVTHYAYGEVIDKATGPIFVRGPSVSDNLRQVLQGKLDALLADEIVARYLMEHYPDADKKFVVGSQPIVKRPLYFAIRKDRRDARAIIEKFNAQMHAMVVDGTYNRILNVRWIQADVDGDGVNEFILGGRQAGLLPPTDGYTLVAKSSEPQQRRFVVEGKIYQDWDAVPTHYKTPFTRESDSAQRGIILLEF